MAIVERVHGLARVALPALTVMLGMQVLRAFLPLLVFVLRDRMGWNAMQLGVYAVALFSLSFLAAPLWRLLGVRTSLLATAGALGVVRLGMQLWWGDPLLLLGLATLGTLAFILFLPTYLVAERPSGPAATGRYGIAILLGFAADAALHGALFTWDLAWQRQPWAIAVAAALVGSQLLALCLFLRDRPALEARAAARAGASSLPWLGMGPVLALTLLVFDNIARAAALSGWRSPVAFTAVMVAQAAGVAAATLALTPRGLGLVRRSSSGLALALGMVLVVTTAVTTSSAILTFGTLVVGQAALALLLGPALSGLGRAGDRATRGRLSAVGAAGMLVFVATLFLTYAGYDIALPLPAAALGPIAAGILALSAIPSFRLIARDASAVGASSPGTHPAAAIRPGPSPRANGWRPALAAVVLLAIPATVLATDRPAETHPATGALRLMTYNIHNGFDTDGRLDLEALARTIEEQDPDVVALQEIARGWVVDGSADTLAWLSRRLGMGATVYGPTAGPLWGNAILSRVPITAAEVRALPTEDLLLQRGYIRARVEGNADERPIGVIATHYHHLEDGTSVRIEESRALLATWNGAPRTIIMGDLNAEPGAPEIELLRSSFVEAVDEAGISPGYTYSSDDPYQRIDYIWVTPDLATPAGAGGLEHEAGGDLRDVVITTGTASDHLGVAATIEP